jgi:hypothetical protein
MIRNVIRQNSLTTKWLLFFVTEKYDDVGLMVRNEKLLFFLSPLNKFARSCVKEHLFTKDLGISFDIVEDSWMLF